MNEDINKGLFGDIKLYIHSIRFYIIFMAINFFGIATLGYVFSSSNPDLSIKMIALISQGFGELILLSSFHLMVAIFIRNSFACLLSIVLGLFFGIAPIGIISLNGFIVGVVVFVAQKEIGFVNVLLGIVPHGIIELPIVFISAAIGMKIGNEVLRTLLKTEDSPNLKKEFFSGLQVFVYVVLPLLFVAAMIEAYITSAII